MISSKEHELIEFNFEDSEIKKFNTCFNSNHLEDNVKYLGIHQYENDKSLNLRSYYYIGYRWLNHKEYIKISPKLSNNYQADYLKMFLICLRDPIVSKRLNETYNLFFNEKWIEVDNASNDEITPLLILQFLQLVNNITKRGLKKGYINISENMRSSIKGKILINKTIRQNHYKNRLDRTTCKHQIYTINCNENQIIKTALTQCSRNLHGINNNDIVKLLKQNLNAYALVDTKEVSEYDFSKVKNSSFYKDYKEALRISKMIFRLFGFSLNGSSNEYKYKIPPFFINMPELFERYVEVKLREKYKGKLIPGYGRDDGNSYAWGLRPDFIVQGEKKIIDAKYKYWFLKSDNSDDFKQDYQQLSLYGRVKEIRSHIGIEKNSEPELFFYYPSIKSAGNTPSKDENFNNIFKYGIKIPSYRVNS